MSSTTEITHHLESLSIAANASSSAILSESVASNGRPTHIGVQPAVSSKPATQATQSRSLQEHSSDNSEHLEASTAQDVDMADDPTSQDADVTDDLLTRTANLSVERHQPITLATLTARFRESAERRRQLQAMARDARPSTVSNSATAAAPAQASRSATCRSPTSPSPTSSRPRRYPRPSRSSGDHDARRFFRSRAQIHRDARRQRRQQAEAVAAMLRELRFFYGFEAEEIYAQLEAVAAAIYGPGH